MAYLLVAPNTRSYLSRKCWRTDGGSGEFLNGLVDSTYKDHDTYE
jgi:hypothetical protein